MSLINAVGIGNAGNNLSKKITGTDEVSAGRTVVAAGAGAVLGTVAGGAVTVALGTVAAPVAVPLAVVGGLFAGIRSLFD